MGCISSKSSNDALELMVPKHDDMLTIDAETKEHGRRRWSLEENKLTTERCSSFHTVEEYDELLQRISSSKDDDGDDAEVVGVPVPDTNSDQPVTDSACRKDGDDEGVITEKKTEDIEFQTVASLKQWLHAPHDAEVNSNADTEYLTPKSAFDFYDDNTETPVDKLVTGKKQEDETIIELVVAFDQYMQQLQIDEDKILKQIHNMID